MTIKLKFTLILAIVAITLFGLGSNSFQILYLGIITLNPILNGLLIVPYLILGIVLVGNTSSRENGSECINLIRYQEPIIWFLKKVLKNIITCIIVLVVVLLGLAIVNGNFQIITGENILLHGLAIISFVIVFGLLEIMFRPEFSFIIIITYALIEQVVVQLNLIYYARDLSEISLFSIWYSQSINNLILIVMVLKVIAALIIGRIILTKIQLY